MLWISTEVRLQDVRPGALGGSIVARAKEGVTREQLAAELTGLSKDLPARFGGSPAYARLIGQHSAVVESLPDRIIGPTLRTSLWVLLGAVGVVLLIACANVANLFMVRAESRRRDMTVRHAMGASRAQLARLQLAESFAVALIAGVLAILLSVVTLPAFIRAAPEGVPRLDQAGLDLPTLAATFGLVILIGLACGAVPAIRASAPGFAGLRDGGRGLTSSRHRVRDVLVVAQTALALVLLIGSALLVQSFNRLRAVDPGYDTKDLYTFQFAPDQPQLVDGPSVGQFHLAAMERMRALPGVTGVGLVNNLPLDEGTSTWRFLADGAADDGGGVRLDVNWVGGDYFRIMGIDLLAGRILSDQEAVTPNSNAIVSRSAAQRLWPGRDALGQSFSRATADNVRQVFTVVGVVEDVKQDDWREAGEAAVYFPLTGPAPRVGVWLTGLRAQIPPGRPPAERGAGADPRDRPRSAGLSRIHHGLPGPALDGAALVHDAHAGRGLRARPDPRRGGTLRRAVLCGDPAPARDRRAHGPRRHRGRGAPRSGLAGDESGADRGGHRTGDGGRDDETAGHAAVWSEGGGSDRVRGHGRDDGWNGDTGELCARKKGE